MNRFFAPKGNILSLSESDENHIINVLRLREGDEIIICDGNLIDYRCSITQISKNSLDLRIVERFENNAEPPSKITLYQGFPKADKLELIIQKCVELGIFKIVPVLTERTIVKIKPDFSKKLDRLQKISEAAAKQSGRGIIPEICMPISFKDAVKEMGNYDLSLMPYEGEKENNLKGILSGFSGENISIFIGPEGGFSEKEVEFAKSSKIQTVSLGNRILRTETAGLATLAITLHEIGEL